MLIVINYQYLYNHNFQLMVMVKKDKITVQGTKITVLTDKERDYISLTDMAGYEDNMKAYKVIIFIWGLLFTLTFAANSTTWSPIECTCPICKHKHEYQEVSSYGGYVYNWSSKFQYVYWPLTDSYSVYSCPKCHFSTYMWDFHKVPEDKIALIKEYLATVTIDNKYEDYDYIPITKRLEIAENVYKILERDNKFWCEFYRLIGYHYDQEKNATKAKLSRVIALNIANKMLLNPSNEGQKKELLYIVAAMNNYINKKDCALFYLDKASTLTYQNNRLKKDESKGLDEYLTDLIEQYKELIKKDSIDTF